MAQGRKKKERILCLDPAGLVCGCRGPLNLANEKLAELEQVWLEPDELQALAFRDLERFSMADAAAKMGISKTVFAGIYTVARKKQTSCLIEGKILLVRCEKSGKNPGADFRKN